MSVPGVPVVRTILNISFAASLAILYSATPVSAQQPPRDASEIAPTPGLTPIETPGGHATPRPGGTARPKRTRTPQREGASTVDRRSGAGTGGFGSGRPAPPSGIFRSSGGWHAPTEMPDARDVGTWSLFSILVVLLGLLTIRMVRRPPPDYVLFDRWDADEMEAELPG